MQGLCEEGEGGKFVDRGDNTYGGKYVVNPSGGLISKGHPLGATGLAQCAELNWQVLWCLYFKCTSNIYMYLGGGITHVHVSMCIVYGVRERERETVYTKIGE